MNLAVVIPSIREECMTRWMQEWQELKGTRIILVEDNPRATFTTSMGIEHYSWHDIDQELGSDSWIIPRRTDAICSFGFLKALQGDADVIWTLSDDCYPEEGRRGTYLHHLQAFFTSSPVADDSWHNTIDGMYPRGYPYGVREKTREVMFHHGLWSNIPDLDGETQLANPEFRLPPCHSLEIVPSQKFFPMSNMNIMFRAELTPVMYQLLMGQDRQGHSWGFSRFADIWSGLFMKKVTDKLGWAVTSGLPSIHHSRASDPHRNVELEAPGKWVNEEFWTFVRDLSLTQDTPAGCYLEIADALERCTIETPRPYYWHSLAEAMRTWVRYAEMKEG
jgi:reversibly glycosylated polypeptide / UDP-arabinopyranose mutase